MIAEVIVDVAVSQVDRVFEYAVPPGFDISVGVRVVVPFGNRVIDGFVLKLKEKSSLPLGRLKSILKTKSNKPEISEEMLALCDFMVEKYNIKKVEALRLFISAEVRSGKVKPKSLTYLALNPNLLIEDYEKTLKRLTEKQKTLLDFLKENPLNLQSELRNNFGTSVVDKFKKDGLLLVKEINVDRRPDAMKIEKKSVVLNPEQKRAVDTIGTFLPKTYVLFGVTGSGKTEVYLTLIEKALENGKTAILLVPEISLTPQMLGNLKNRFGETVAVLHSGLSQGEKFDEWHRILDGEAKVVVGARSAIFAPLENVGIIVIDEEHEGSYNSETSPRYKTIEVAEFRKNFNNCPLVLGSATPSIETFAKTETGEYELLELPHRASNFDMPKVQIVDMLSEIRAGNGGMFSRALLSELDDCFRAKKQAILFLNRRGYTSFLRCAMCGYIPRCTDCDAPLVYHKEDEKLKCHFCGKNYRVLTQCPKCGSKHIRQGAIGTQKIVAEIKEIFPDIPVFRMDNDTVSGKNGHQKILEEFTAVSPAILVGTQMIAKGHDFKNVELVGIVDADQSLYQSDYRATEKTFQLITQVSGRAGRHSGLGKTILQSYAPKHYVYRFAANYDYKGFFNREINIRETTDFPPFSTIVRILITHEKENLVVDLTRELMAGIKEVRGKYFESFIYLGANKSPHTRIKNKFRYQIVMRFTKGKECDIIKEIYAVVNGFKDRKPSIITEINPSSLS